MRLGLANALVPTDPEEVTPELAAKIAALGVNTVKTHFRVPATELIGKRGKEIAAIFEQAGLDISFVAGVRADLVTPDEEARGATFTALHNLMLSAHSLGASWLTVGCGSFNPAHPYGPARENHLESTRERLIGNLKELSTIAGDTGVVVVLEPHVLTTLNTPKNVREIIDEVDSPWIRVNFDLVNFLGSLDDVYDSGAFAKQSRATLGSALAPSADIKDVIVEAKFVLHIAEVPPGEGILDLEGVLESCKELPDGAMLFVEHLLPDQAAAGVRYVAELAAKVGISFE